jgi:uncharacterized cupredoxin-like copper-binding protein
MLLAACGGSSSNAVPVTPPAPVASEPATAPTTDASPDTSATPSDSPSSASPDSGSATTVTATETEMAIALSTSTFKAGTYTFVVKNAGSVTHALTIDGPGVEDQTSGDVAPGESGKVTVTLKPGSYDLYCPVGDHKAEGMDTHVTVS